MSSTLEATRLWMLALCLAAIPLTLMFEMLWESVHPRPLTSHRHRTTAGLRSPFHLRALSHPLGRVLFVHLPFVVAVLILTAYLVVVMVSNTL